MTFVPISGGPGAVRLTVRSGLHQVAECSTPVPVPSSLSDRQVLIDRLKQAHLEITAWPGAVPRARHHARQMLCDMDLQELIEPVELVVTEIVSNAVRASGGLDCQKRGAGEPPPVVRLWLVPERDGVLVLVWDGNPSQQQRQELPPDADSGRGLVLVEALSAAWGSFELADEPGKVVWALCQN